MKKQKKVLDLGIVSVANTTTARAFSCQKGCNICNSNAGATGTHK